MVAIFSHEMMILKLPWFSSEEYIIVLYSLNSLFNKQFIAWYSIGAVLQIWTKAKITGGLIFLKKETITVVSVVLTGLHNMVKF